MTKVDSRSVHTDALATLGTIIDASQKRDAIHLAVIPVQAKVRVWPGQHVNKEGLQVPSELVGIVDPFLPGPVQPEEWFWLVIYPRVITSLRHVWTHPAFSDEGPDIQIVKAHPIVWNTPTEDELPKPVVTMSASERYLREQADEVGLSYARLLEAADEYVRYGSRVHGGSEYEGVWIDDEFWTHYEKVTGKSVPDEKRGSFFSCSC